ncbi:hypothetical protein C8Q77DRAFT_1151854 [Trametes polyzona]|nr:hypothetical protein C8Q77DRAFT_1151854 [Trametes polyzona]
MAPTALATMPNSNNPLPSVTPVFVFVYPPVFQVAVILSMVSLVLRYFGSRVSTISTTQTTLPVDVELQADAPDSVFVRRSRFWQFSPVFRRLRTTSRDAWLDFTATLMVLGRGGSSESLPLPVLSPRASSLSVSAFIRKLFGRTCRALLGRVVSHVEVTQPELSYPVAWAPCGVTVLSVVEANIKFAYTETPDRHDRPCLQTSIAPSTPTTPCDYTFPRAPSGITPSGVG